MLAKQKLLPDEVLRLRRQIDHYFCDFNLQSGHYLRRRLQDPGYITSEELMAFNKVCQLSNNSVENVEAVLSAFEFEFVAFDPLTKRLTRREDRPFKFVPKFWRSRARLSVYLLCFPDEFDQSQIQQSIPGVAFVRLVREIQKSVLADDDSLRDLEDSFSSLNCSDYSDENAIKESNKRKPHAILYFENEASMNELLQACGPNREFYFDNNNRKCYIRPRREDRLEPLTASPKPSSPTLYQAARQRTMVWFSERFRSKDDSDRVKAMFQPKGVILCFFTADRWLLFFKTGVEFRHFKKEVDSRSLMTEGKFVPLDEFETEDVQLKNYASFMKVLRNFYRK